VFTNSTFIASNLPNGPGKTAFSWRAQNNCEIMTRAFASAAYETLPHTTRLGTPVSFIRASETSFMVQNNFEANVRALMQNANRTCLP